MPARIVITGADGRAGRRLSELAGQQGRDVLAVGRADWDIADPGAGARHVRSGDVVVNCAAYTNVDGAEADADLIHISTDYVFGAAVRTELYEPDDPTWPLSVYGRTKLAGGLAGRRTLPGAQVARTSWAYHGCGTDFVAVVRRLAAGAGPVRVVADQVGSPTYVGDLASVLLALTDRPASIPVVHLANTGAVSRFELACAVFAGGGADPSRQPVATAHMPRPAPRPRCSALGQVESVAAGAPALRAWSLALEDALAVQC